MIKHAFRTLALSALIATTTLFAAPLAQAHEIKHHHQQVQQQPNVIMLMLKAIAQPSYQAAPQPTHNHYHKAAPKVHMPAPKIQSSYPTSGNITKVHADMCVTGTSWLNARSGPSTNHKVLAELGEGQKVHVTTCETTNYGKSTWCKFDAGYGKTAYVSKKYIASCPQTYRNY